MATTALRVSALHKGFAEQAVLCGLDLHVEPGECFALLGPNGAGKTTAMRCILGLSAADSGTVELLGHHLPAAGAAARAEVGVVPQFDNLDPDFSCAENLRVYARYFGIPAHGLEARIAELLHFAQLEHKADTPIRALSGGMKRRLSLARALIHRPRLLLLDEPTTGLDPQARHQMWEGLQALRSAGTTLLLTTHFMDEAERLADRVAVMDHGRILACDSPRALIARHIEARVLEIYSHTPNAAREWAATHAATRALRHEISGETVFCYVDDPSALQQHLASQDGLRYLARPANLEDVFLKLTGRELRD